VSGLTVGLLVSLALGADGVESREVTGRGYERQPVGALSSDGCGLLVNAEDIRFPEALEDWGLIVAYGLFDGDELVRACSAGRVLDVHAGDDIVFGPGRFRLRDEEFAAAPKPSRLLA
jgi:hypothetical protein